MKQHDSIACWVCISAKALYSSNIIINHSYLQYCIINLVVYILKAINVYFNPSVFGVHVKEQR